MESRFFRFGKAKRQTSNAPASAAGLQSIPYNSTISHGVDPIFIHQPLGKSIREVKRLEEQGLLLKAVAYDTLTEGKTPQFGHTPQKGNGPVKLQASRRGSLGELMATTHDNQRILEDIREGEYIIGGKDRRDQNSPSPNVAHRQSTVVTTNNVGPSLRSRPSTSRSAVTNGTSVWSSGPITPTSPLPQAAYTQGLGISSPWMDSPSSQQDAWIASSPELDTKYVRRRPKEQTNATILALKKAGNGRLSQLYSNPPALPGFGRAPSSPAAPTRLSLVPDRAHLDLYNSKRFSHGSGRSSVYSNDISDTSSVNQESASSSWAASSASTTQTSLEEAESPTTRDNIRKLIEEMRSNYLQAIESAAPATPSTKSTKQRRKPRLSASPTLEESYVKVDRQTWHGHDAISATALESRPKSRHASHPVHAFGRLSPIEASPPRNDASLSDDRTPELRRADSMTLGNLMSQIPEVPKEPTVVVEKVADTTQRPVTPTQSEHSDWLELKLPKVCIATISPDAESSDVSRNESTLTLPKSMDHVQEVIQQHRAPDAIDASKTTTTVSLAELVAFI